MSSSCFELLLASFIQLECSPAAGSTATGESWANERVLEKIGDEHTQDLPVYHILNPPLNPPPPGFDVGLRMAERCSKDFPKRMGTELQVSVPTSFLPCLPAHPLPPSPPSPLR